MTESDIRKISICGVIILVVLRLAIGWQMLYEGLWKFQTQNTASPWTAEPYLKSATGPLRDYYRGLTGDPNDLRYMDYDTVAARWTKWAESFADHYGLTDAQRRSLNTMLNGPAEFSRALEQLPEGVDLSPKKGRGIHYDPERKRLVVDGKLHMTPREKQEVLRQVNFNEATDTLADIEDDVVRKFVDEVQKIYQQQSRLSFAEQALSALKGNPEFAGQEDKAQAGTIDERRLGKIELYKKRLARYEEKLASARTQFDQDHLDWDWREIQKLRLELVGPIRALENDLRWRAEKLLTTEQLARGPLAVEWTSQRDIDLKTMWGLTIIGALLIAGFCTRLAALGGAFLILQFYLASPPFPGYPHPPGPEHSYIVNKNLIEVLVLLAFVFLPSGRWFGVDAIWANLFTKKKANDRR